MSMQGRPPSLPLTIWTVGHSNRPLEEFVRLLQTHGATLVVDVRKMPGSRRNPQFGCDTLPQALRQAGIGYVHMPGLGGCAVAGRTRRTRAGRMLPSRGTPTTC